MEEERLQRAFRGALSEIRPAPIVAGATQQDTFSFIIVITLMKIFSIFIQICPTSKFELFDFTYRDSIPNVFIEFIYSQPEASMFRDYLVKLKLCAETAACGVD